ncbi:hypothetical protein PR048_002432 [Dryococelus australis]|uniref:Uncharacterized protein n=1 Tax=Dryococelus australis TaxID=614101 RepID=A0ABQ9IKB8_9NEOP|nr:hypothetical protein PR048_002432 [Dryococelus australis]
MEMFCLPSVGNEPKNLELTVQHANLYTIELAAEILQQRASVVNLPLATADRRSRHGYEVLVVQRCRVDRCPGGRRGRGTRTSSSAFVAIVLKCRRLFRCCMHLRPETSPPRSLNTAVEIEGMPSAEIKRTSSQVVSPIQPIHSPPGCMQLALLSVPDSVALELPRPSVSGLDMDGHCSGRKLQTAQKDCTLVQYLAHRDNDVCDGRAWVVLSVSPFWGKYVPEISEKTRRPAASSCTLPTCENQGLIWPGIELGSPWWEESGLTTIPPWPRECLIADMYTLARPGVGQRSRRKLLYAPDVVALVWRGRWVCWGELATPTPRHSPVTWEITACLTCPKWDLEIFSATRDRSFFVTRSVPRIPRSLSAFACNETRNELAMRLVLRRHEVRDLLGSDVSRVKVNGQGPSHMGQRWRMGDVTVTGRLRLRCQVPAAVAEWLDCSPPIMANRVQSRPGHSLNFASGNLPDSSATLFGRAVESPKLVEGGGVLEEGDGHVIFPLGTPAQRGIGWDERPSPAAAINAGGRQPGSKARAVANAAALREGGKICEIVLFAVRRRTKPLTRSEAGCEVSGIDRNQSIFRNIAGVRETSRMDWNDTIIVLLSLGLLCCQAHNALAAVIIGGSQYDISLPRIMEEAMRFFLECNRFRYLRCYLITESTSFPQQTSLAEIAMALHPEMEFPELDNYAETRRPSMWAYPPSDWLSETMGKCHMSDWILHASRLRALPAAHWLRALQHFPVDAGLAHALIPPCSRLCSLTGSCWRLDLRNTRLPSRRSVFVSRWANRMGNVAVVAVGWWVFSDLFCFPHSCIPPLLHIDLIPPLPVLRISLSHAGMEGRGETGDPREKRSNSGIVRHDSHMRKSMRDPVCHSARIVVCFVDRWDDSEHTANMKTNYSLDICVVLLKTNTQMCCIEPSYRLHTNNIQGHHFKSHSYTLHNDNSALQFRALCLVAMANLVCVIVSSLSLPHFYARHAKYLHSDCIIRCHKCWRLASPDAIVRATATAQPATADISDGPTKYLDDLWTRVLSVATGDAAAFHKGMFTNRDLYLAERAPLPTLGIGRL